MSGKEQNQNAADIRTNFDSMESFGGSGSAGSVAAILQKKGSHAYVMWITISALFMALTVALASFGVPIPAGNLYLCDVSIDMAALILDPLAAFVVGGVGAFLGDVIFFPPSMIVTLFVHGIQAVVISLISHKAFKGHRVLASWVALLVGMVIMVAGYTLGDAFVYGTMATAIAGIPYEIAQAAIGVVGSMLLCFRCGLIRVEKQIYG